ncbi:MAG: hypothetical protein MR923_00575 [Prevotella sp.]|nr:hypothetical protein [Prevotella sp.]
MLQIRETGAFFSEITSATPVCRYWGWGKPSVLSFYRTAINSNIKALHYKDIMRSIEHILSFMARDYKIENLHCLKVDMSSFGEESLNLSKKYIDLYGNGNVIQSSNASDVVEKSNLINDINRMVSVYGLSVKEVMTELPILLILMTFTPIMQR